MCGICGYLTKTNITMESLVKMNDTMYHRGPNDHGEELCDVGKGYTLGLAQRRLSILDLSELGHQPMHSLDRRISLVFNGEIYNFHQLKEELSDYPFKSNCDTEVIIAAYLKWGIQCVEKFNGMFAIALYDREEDTLYLVRDRIGKKPLYYWIDKGNIVFASELKPIMSLSIFPKNLRQDIMARYIFHQYINAPDSIFENVSKLEPGTIGKFKLGVMKTWKYWEIKNIYHQNKGKNKASYHEAKEELKQLLKNAVVGRMISDVPLGTFLSGGYDSSLITAIAQEHSSVPVKTYSIGFNEEKYNEAKYAKEVAMYLGTKHTEEYIEEKDMMALVQSIPKYYDEPFADSSQIPTMLVSQLARKEVTVALSGDGGDEFFCGYNAYQKVDQARKLDKVGGIIHGVSRFAGLKQADILEKIPLKARIIINNRNIETKTQFGSPIYYTLSNEMLKRQQLDINYHFERKYHEKNWQERRMLLDMDTYLPGDILCKVDRASMKYSLETRCPILDVKVMEYAYSLPHHYKYDKGNKKRILKDVAYDYIPKSMLDRPKVGFGVPLDKWLRGPLKEQLLDMSNLDFLKKQDIFDADYLHGLFANYFETGDGGLASGTNYSKFIWSYFVFQMWYLEYMS